jgi:hypothetical protein
MLSGLDTDRQQKVAAPVCIGSTFHLHGLCLCMRMLPGEAAAAVSCWLVVLEHCWQSCCRMCCPSCICCISCQGCMIVYGQGMFKVFLTASILTAMSVSDRSNLKCSSRQQQKASHCPTLKVQLCQHACITVVRWLLKLCTYQTNCSLARSSTPAVLKTISLIE